MLTYVLEFTEVDLHITSEQIAQFMTELEMRSLPFDFEDEGNNLLLSVHQDKNKLKLPFKQIGETFKLRCKQLRFADQVLAELFQDMVTRLRGHAVMKLIGPDSTVIHQIQFGEAIRITQVNGNRRKVLLDRAESVTIERVMEAFQMFEVEERIPLLRVEIDEELSRLAEHLKQNNTKEVENSKKRLKELWREMLILEM